MPGKEIKKSKKESWFKAFIGLPFIIELIIGVCLFLFFKPTLDTFFKTISTSLFGNLQADDLTNTTWIILIIAITLGFLAPVFPREWNYPNFRTSPKAAVTLLAVTFIYCFGYRYSPKWNFIGLEYIKYSDILVWFTFINSVSWLTYLIKQPEKKNNNAGFSEDSPYIDKTESPDFEDLFLYGNYAQKIADEIVKTYPKHSFTIGINGEWGSGKTSFMNMIAERATEKPKMTLIRFNAWESSDAKHIVPDFLDELKSKVGIGNSYLAKKISQYAEKLSPLDKSGWLKTAHSFTTKSNTISGLKHEISQMLLKSGHRLLILIDDLDRLDTDELLEVYRLVRNSIDFSNVIFIMCYDRGYVDKAVNKQNEHQAGSFIEKIVNSEYTLPIIFIDDLRDDLKKNLEVIVKSMALSELEQTRHLSEIFEAIDFSRIYKEKDFLVSFLSNGRDITRLLNSMKVNLRALLGEVLFFDFFYLELIKLKHPDIYLKLQNPNNDLLEKQTSSSQYCYVLKQDQSFENTGLLKVLKELFHGNQISHIRDPNQLGVRYQKNYRLYFRYFLESSEFSESEFRKFLHGDNLAFKKQIKKWTESGLEISLTARIKLEWKGSLENKLHFQNLLESSFYLASLPSKITGQYFVGFRDTEIQYKLLDINYEVSSEFYSSSDEMKEYIKNQLIKDDQDWNWGKSDLVDQMKNLSQNEVFGESHCLFNRNELVKLNIQYLETALIKMHPKRYNQVIAFLLSKCRDKNNGDQLEPSASRMVLTYCKENNVIEDVFMSFIGRSIVVGAPYSTARYSFIGDWEEFFSDLNELKEEIKSVEWKYSDEYLQFIEVWSDANKDKSTYIEYPFSPEFMKDLDDFWTMFNEMPVMPLARE